MEEPVEELYFNWLYHKVAAVDNPTPSLTYYTLFRDLHSIEFVWLISGDDNREQDGLDLRREFYRTAFIDEDIHWMNLPCSVLEMLIAFSRRAEFDTNISYRDWFWVFMENLRLKDLNDAQSNITVRANDLIERFVWRTYSSNGLGGLFPLMYPQHDQRDVEVWYQFCEYLVDRGLL